MSLGKALHKAGIINQEQLDASVKQVKEATNSQKHFQIRKARKLFLSKKPKNRFGEPVTYEKWIYDNKFATSDCRCGLCNTDITKYEEATIELVNEELVLNSRLLEEKDFINFILSINDSKMKKLLLNLNGMKMFTQYRIDKLDIEFKVCYECVAYYIKNRYYPNHLNNK